MELIPAIAAAILAQAVFASPVPSALSKAATTTSTTIPPAPADNGLSLTANFRLADTVADRFALLPDDKQLVFDFNQKRANAGKGGGVAVGRINACGMNTLHVHLRGTELQTLVQGRLITEMVPESGVDDAQGKQRVIRTELRPFMMTPFFQGSVHVRYNPDCEDAVFVSSLSSEDVGAGQAAIEAFALSDKAVAAVLGQSIKGADIDKIRAAIPKSIALGVEECLIKCNITKSK